MGGGIVSSNGSLDGSGREAGKTFSHVPLAESLKNLVFLRAAIQGLVLKKGMSIA